ncbi:MAG: GspE/PulE family protein [Planctomycetaceae bacterium]
MTRTLIGDEFSRLLSGITANDDRYVPEVVRLILQQARRHRASDVHLIPEQHQFTMLWRIDGVLQVVAGFDTELAPRLVARLKVLSGLLTYRCDVPQEGRISVRSVAGMEAERAAGNAGNASEPEVRVTTFPTLFGEKVAIRLFAASDRLQLLSDLNLPVDIQEALQNLLQQTSGVVLLSGPSGSGKTTTVYACLREILQQSGRCRALMSLEDPIEVMVPGVTQSQVRPSIGFDLESGLKSMMRQDPDVIMVGEIRDPATAECAFQAALTGHLVLTTFHAGSSCEAVTRLLDMGIEPYLLRSTLRAVVCQRLLRQSCSQCRPENSGSKNSAEFLDKSFDRSDHSQNCRTCGGTGYFGRFLMAELLNPDQPDVARSILDRADVQQLQRAAEGSGLQTLRERCHQAVQSGLTTAEEVFRILGRNEQ